MYVSSLDPRLSDQSVDEFGGVLTNSAGVPHWAEIECARCQRFPVDEENVVVSVIEIGWENEN